VKVCGGRPRVELGSADAGYATDADVETGMRESRDLGGSRDVTHRAKLCAENTDLQLYERQRS